MPRLIERLIADQLVDGVKSRSRRAGRLHLDKEIVGNPCDGEIDAKIDAPAFDTGLRDNVTHRQSRNVAKYGNDRCSRLGLHFH